MLRKLADDEGKDWDRLLPYVLFAYREVPQASTGFSPFELVYGRAVRGPLDILKESWQASKQSSENVVSYVLTIQERLAKMSELAQENLKKLKKIRKSGMTETLENGDSNLETMFLYYYHPPAANS